MIKRLIFSEEVASDSLNDGSSDEDDGPGMKEEEATVSIPDSRRGKPKLDTEVQGFSSGMMCTLCPQKKFMMQDDLEKHLHSRQHLKREQAWEKKLKESTSAEADSEKAEVAIPPEESSRKRKTASTKKKRKSKDLTSDQIIKRKRLFQLKKERRESRKLAAADK